MNQAPDAPDEEQPLRGTRKLLFDVLAGGDRDPRRHLAELRRSDPHGADVVQGLLDRLDAFGLLEESQGPAHPERIGDYRVLDLLGSGGMGLVYLAEHESLGRRVALKVVHQGLASSPRARERFRREALAASRLDHPGICPVYDVDTGGEPPYIAMRLVPGHTLTWHIRESRRRGRSCVVLPGAEEAAEARRVMAIVGLFERAADALHEAHAAGLVHRDVKPDNLMITPEGEPVLLDFGLAQLGDADHATLTLAGEQLGTPLYMAPEQIGGATVDAHTDVYALGVMLYECLTLRVPFEAASRESLFQQILRADPPDPRRANPTIGRDLVTVLRTATAKEPRHRYRTAAAFAEDLRRLRQREPILARRAGPLLRLRRFIQRNPLAAGFVGFLLAASFAFAALAHRLDASLRTADANGQALEARAYVGTAPIHALAAALDALAHENNVDTRSALFEALVRCHERARLQHDTAVRDAMFSPDGETVLTCADTRAAILWQAADGRRLAVLPHPGITRASYSPDGRFVVTLGAGASVKLWSADGGLLRDLDPGVTRSGRALSAIETARFDPKSRWLAVSRADGSILVWDVREASSCELVVGPTGTGMPPRHVSWSSDGRLLATAEQETRGALGSAILVFEFDGRELVERHRRASRLPVRHIELSPDDGSLLFLSDSRARTREWSASVWDLTTDDVHDLEHHRAALSGCFSPDGRHVLTSGVEGIVRLWSRADDGYDVQYTWAAGRTVAAAFCGPDRIVTHEGDIVRIHDLELSVLVELRGHDDRIERTPVLSPDGRLLVTSSWDQTARIWDLFSPELPRFAGRQGPVVGLAQLPDGRLVSADDDELFLWNTATGTSTRSPIHVGAESLAISPDGSEVVATHIDTVARCYDVTSGAERRQLPIQGDAGTAALFLGDGRVLTSGRGPILNAHPRAGGPALFGERPGRTNVLARSPLRGLVAGSGWHPTITLWREDDGEQLGEWPAHDMWVNALAFSPDGRLLASGSNDHTVRIWDLTNPRAPKLVRTLEGHDGSVRALAWSAREGLLAAGGSDTTVHLWRTDTWQEVAVLRSHAKSVSAVLFDLERPRLYSASDDGVIQAWPTTVTELEELARGRLARIDQGPGTRPVNRLAHFRFLARFGDPAEARARGKEILEEAAARSDWSGLNQVAWALVGQDESLLPVELELATRAAEKANELTASRNADVLDTLARVKSEQRDFEAAVRWQQLAVAIAAADGDADLDGYRARLSEYEDACRSAKAPGRR